MEIDSRPRAVVVAFAVGLAGFAVGLVVGLVAGLVLGLAGVSLSPEALVALNLVVLQGTAFPLTALAYLRLRGKSLDYLRASLPSPRDLGLGGAAGVAAAVMAFVLLTLVLTAGGQPAERGDAELLQQPTVLLVLLPLAILLIGPGEELLFRGVIQTTLREQFGAAAAIVVASFAFAPAHIIALTGSPSALLVSMSLLFVPSLAFGAVYEYTDNLAAPSLAHGVYDVILFGLAYVSLTANSPDGTGPGVLLVALSP
jgi:membrane protease YdiL (CAAX protease family)